MAEDEQPPTVKVSKIEEGEPVVVLTHKHITDYNRYVKACMDRHKKEREKKGEDLNFDDAKNLMDDCATEWNKLSPEERKEYGNSEGTH